MAERSSIIINGKYMHKYATYVVDRYMNKLHSYHSSTVSRLQCFRTSITLHRESISSMERKQIHNVTHMLSTAIRCVRDIFQMENCAS